MNKKNTQPADKLDPKLYITVIENVLHPKTNIFTNFFKFYFLMGKQSLDIFDYTCKATQKSRMIVLLHFSKLIKIDKT